MACQDAPTPASVRPDKPGPQAAHALPMPPKPARVQPVSRRGLSGGALMGAVLPELKRTSCSPFCVISVSWMAKDVFLEKNFCRSAKKHLPRGKIVCRSSFSVVEVVELVDTLS